MHNIKANYDKIYPIIQQLFQDKVDERENFIRKGPKPKFSDLQVMALSLTAESLGIDSENYLFGKLEKEYRDDFPGLLSRRQYNDRRKGLFYWLNNLREAMVNMMEEFENTYSVDSMPMEVCKIARSNRCKLGKENFETAPDKGYCASQQVYFYGYKLHCLCSLAGVIHSFDMTKASVHDIHYLEDLKYEYEDCLWIGDKGYINAQLQLDLFTTANIQLSTPMRANQRNFTKQPFVFKKARKRIETIFSQLCDQFLIRRNYAKSFLGYKTRILAKITAYTMMQYLNKFINHKPVGHVKYALA